MIKRFFVLSLVLVVGVLFLSGCGKSNSNRLMNDLASEAEETNLPSGSNDCEAACANYVNKCLTLVPNADHILFNEGLNSCLKECSSWSSEKTKCILEAIACPEMTDVCEL